VAADRGWASSTEAFNPVPPMSTAKVKGCFGAARPSSPAGPDPLAGDAALPSGTVEADPLSSFMVMSSR
jgi:hypothetical protein